MNNRTPTLCQNLTLFRSGQIKRRITRMTPRQYTRWKMRILFDKLIRCIMGEA